MQTRGQASRSGLVLVLGAALACSTSGGHAPDGGQPIDFRVGSIAFRASSAAG